HPGNTSMPRKGIARIFNYRIFRGSSGKPDVVFIALFFAVIAFGLIVLSSASAVISYQWYGYTTYFIIHQLLFGLLPGLVLFYIASKIDYHIWKTMAFPFLLATI